MSVREPIDEGGPHGANPDGETAGNVSFSSGKAARGQSFTVSEDHLLDFLWSSPLTEEPEGSEQLVGASDQEQPDGPAEAAPTG